MRRLEGDQERVANYDERIAGSLLTASSNDHVWGREDAKPHARRLPDGQYEMTLEVMA